MSNDIVPEASLSPQERIIREKASRIIRVADEISDGIFGGLYADKYGIFAHAVGKDVYSILSGVQLKPGQKITDLGSGDGRWVFTAALLGLRGEGYEHNPRVYAAAQSIQERLKQEGILTEDEIARVSLHNGDLLKADLSQSNAIIYWEGSGVESDDVERKVLSEAREGTIVIIHGYLRGFEKLKPKNVTLPFIHTQTKVFEVPAK